jgi:hypothetical protein
MLINYLLAFEGPYSFLSVNEAMYNKFNTQELAKLENQLKEKLKSQMILRRRRYTIDNRPCAAAFAQDGKTYFDCTLARSPDGNIPTKEWCYVDIGVEGKYWDFCEPVLDYDKVRKENQQHLSDLTIEAIKVNNELETHISPMEASLNEVSNLNEDQSNLENKLNLLLRDKSAIENNLLSLKGFQKTWEVDEKRVLSKTYF